MSFLVLRTVFRLGTREAHTTNIFPYIIQFVGLRAILELSPRKRNSRGMGTEPWQSHGQVADLGLRQSDSAAPELGGGQVLTLAVI